ncbi:MAG: amidohydrolase family protein [Clostridia bacterium]|nr:amidohydrolase family protein [Clostridia bacterium]
MRICFHTHCFPDALAPRAIKALADTAEPCGYRPHTDGTAAGTVAYLKKAGIDAALVCNIATNTHQERKVNDFAVSLAKSDLPLFAAGSVHPDGERPEEELDRLQAAGICGIKIHPDYVGIDITDPRFDRIFSLAEERKMFVVTHTGFDPVSPTHIHATAQGLLEVVRRHPNLTLIAAHMGGPRQSDEVLRLLAGTPIWFDTSLCAIRPEERENLLRLLREHSHERILFGTDTPWSYPEKEVDFVESAGLSEQARENIFHRNAERLLRLE